MARRPRSGLRATPSRGRCSSGRSGGMRELVDALAGALGDRVRTGAEVTRRRRPRRPARRRLRAGRRRRPRLRRARGGRAPRASGAPTDLSAIHSVSTGVVFLVYPSGTADALPDGTGFVVPRGEAPMTAATFLSRKWPDERFGDRAVVRCYVGRRGRRGRARRAGRGHRRGVRTAPERRPRSPGALGIARPPMVARDASVRDRTPRSRPPDPRGACRRVSSSSGAPSTGSACPTSRAPPKRRPRRCSQTRAPLGRSRHDRDDLRPVPGVRREPGAPRRALRGRRPPQRRGGDRDPLQGLGRPGGRARLVLDGRVPRRRRPRALADRRLGRRPPAVRRRVPEDPGG